MLTILIGTDPDYGELPLLLREDEAAPPGSFRWRIVAQTDDESTAAEIMQMTYRRCYGQGASRSTWPETRRASPGRAGQP